MATGNYFDSNRTITENHKQHDVKRKDQAFWASCTPPHQSGISPSF
jgi:hypothetical protein